jgi:hypothetical protein
MGNQATVVILTDALSVIEKDVQFGKRLSDAIQNQFGTCKVDLNACDGHSCSSAGEVVEVHHCDGTVAILAGGGMASSLGYVGSYTLMDPDRKIDALRELASDLGYSLRKKAPKKKA